jgi:5'-deoxynucleotidase YfbR-like HD superfamily hydrolase
MTFLTRYLQLRRSGAVRRWHTVPHAPRQTVAEHSFHTALLAVALWGEDTSSKLLRWCLTHDLAEGLVADVPAPARWADPALGAAVRRMEQVVEAHLDLTRYMDLDPEDTARAKLLDALEVLFFAAEQVRAGARTEFAPIMVAVWERMNSGMWALPELIGMEVVRELDDFVRATRFPAWRCERCGEFAHVTEQAEGLRWCLSCQGHDIGTIMATRVAREARIGNDDPHDAFVATRALPYNPTDRVRVRVSAVGAFTASNGMLIRPGTEGLRLDYIAAPVGQCYVKLMNEETIVTPTLYWKEI